MGKSADLVLVVARARNGVIGRQGALPWRLSSDLQRFKALTLGKPILMGRRTWDSLPLRPLPGRLNIVLTRDQSLEPTGAVVCDSFADAVSIAREQAEEDGASEICVIGGAEIYRIAMPRARRIYLTEVALEPEGDARFDFDATDGWREISREAVPQGPKDEAASVFLVLERKD